MSMGSLFERGDAKQGRRHGWLAWAERIMAGVGPQRDGGATTTLHLESLETRDLMAVADPTEPLSTAYQASAEPPAYVAYAGLEDESPTGLCGAATAPVITGIELEEGGLDDSGVTTDQTIVLLGTASADSVVTITLVGTGVIGTAQADASGQWRFDYSTEVLPAGDYSFFATAPAAGPLGIATDFNLFVFDNMSHQYTDVGGRIAVGGNATVTGYGVGTAISNSNGTRDDFIVGGNLTYSNGQVYNGNVVVGGTANVSSSANILHGSLRHDTVIDFDAAELALQAQSQAYAAIPANGEVINQWGGLTLRGADPDLNVFDLPAGWLGSTWGITFDVPAGSTVLINVAGATAQMQYFGMTLGNADPNQILWNFHGATQLTIQGINVKGSILAPYAAVQFNNGALDGTLVAKSFAGQGEIHNVLLDVTCPPVESQPFNLTITGDVDPPGEFEPPSEIDTRGVAVDWDAGTAWVIDSSSFIFIYNLDRQMQGYWEAIGVADPGDLLQIGDDLWVADYSANRVYRFTGGASLRSGEHAATEEYELPADTNLATFVAGLDL